MASKSGRDSDPLIGFNFALKVDGAKPITGYFMEVSGIGSENEVIEHKVVDEKGTEIVQKIPGRVKYQDVTLKRGITDTMDMWEWRQLVELGKMKDARSAATITMLDRNYEPIAIWHFQNAWPSKLAGPSVKSDSNEVGVEELTLVHERMYREK